MLNEEKKWYEKAGKESDVVISTRVRLARNLADMPFPNRMTPDQKAAVERRVRDAILSGNSAIASDFDFVQMDDLSNEQAVSLVERHIVSPEFICKRKGTRIPHLKGRAHLHYGERRRPRAYSSAA